ncbi:MAG TPA: transglycosylase SLT domain-containing protein [Bacteroidales bacterium]|nr:transglycosylase SLT domain-containing protein [Bacteroidales bacterium]HRZ48777.1 transglycosylase SLT domain-containing protein [Bacteroidales bacterium]
MPKTALILLLLLIQHALLQADNKPYPDTSSTAVSDELRFRNDDPIMLMLDSMINLSYLAKHMPLYAASCGNPKGFCSDDIPYYTDSVISVQMEALNLSTPFDLIYNAQVQKFIDFYAYRRRASVARMLGLGRLYFPLFEETLDKYNLPVELKYLAIVESALNPVAVSRAGAVGLWQFMPSTGRLYGLTPGQGVDDRRDPFLATDAACRHFVDLYARFGDWNLVLAAYNAGPGGVARAVKKAGGVNDYWKVQPYLPRETQSYVPAFIAVCYVMAHHQDFNIMPVSPPFDYYVLDTVAVRGYLTLDFLAEKMSMDRESLGFLNPALKSGIIYATPEDPWYITLPRQYVGTFIANADLYYEAMKESSKARPDESAAVAKAKSKVHTVRKGESLGVIASKHHCSVTALKKKNKLKSNTIHPGQKLYIP